MPNPINPEHLVRLVAALMRLREDTLAKIFKATGIRSTNLSVWLKGKPQVIADRRVAMLLDYLGVQRGRLRSDMLHRWTIGGSLEDLKTVLGLVLTEQERSQMIVYRDDCHDAKADAVLEITGAPMPTFIVVTVAPTLSGPAEVTATNLGYGKEVHSALPLVGLPVNSVTSFRQAIDAIRQSDSIPSNFNANDVGAAVENILSGVAELLPNAAQYRYGLPPDLNALKAELVAAIKEGILPSDLAALIAKHRKSRVGK